VRGWPFPILAVAAACGGVTAATVDGGSPDGATSGVGSSGSSASSSSSGGSRTDPGSGTDPGQSDANVGSPPWDAAVGTVQDATFDVTPAPAGLAGFAFIVNGVVQTPMSCTGAHWEYPWVAGEEMPASGYPPVPGITSVVIVNTSAAPMPYLAQSYWNPIAHNAVPGGATGITFQLAGVLQPGQQVDITSVYLPGIVALLGSALPFSAAYAADEGTIPWPNGVPGSGGATTMNVAEIEVPYSPTSTCTVPNRVW
jgi:hypothetical protein